MVVASVLAYFLITLLQRSDAPTIRTAREVDAFIHQYCAANNALPPAAVLQTKYPGLNRGTGWFFFTDDRTYLRMQYPMKWRNKDAIGMRRISEFTATVYAYAVDYHCGTAK